MRKLKLPDLKVKECIETCVLNLQDITKKQKYLETIPYLLEQEKVYTDYALNGQLNNIIPNVSIQNNITNSDMKMLYKNKFAHKGQPGYELYNRIKSIPANGICPLCGHRQVSTIDHYLPQSSYTSYILTPVNMIPACADCNKNKLDEASNSEEENFIHPYFDDIDNIPWLDAYLIEQEPPCLIYKVSTDLNISNTLKKRIKKQFTVLKLSELYSIMAAEVISGLKYHLNKIATTEGTDGVRRYLNEHYESYKEYQVNSWQTVAYKTLANNYWFCNKKSY